MARYEKDNGGTVVSYASVAVKVPLDKTFSYRVPKRLAIEAAVGKRVWVPFGSRRMIGYIVGLSDRSGVKKTRPIESVIDKEPIVREDVLALSGWISRYYVCSLGEAIGAAIPGALKKGKTIVKPRKPFKTKRYKRTRGLDLSGEQGLALKEIACSINSSEFRVFLLHGITASGKTEVYMRAIGYALARGRSSIVLVPEIALTPQAAERFKARFGDNVAVIHSGLTSSRRFYEYKRIRDGEARIVVGARSAIFSPVRDLGLVIVDEEHETSYKQETVPRYHARDVAIKRAEITKSVVVLGSATPSLESYHNAKSGRYRLIELRKRIKDMGLPKASIIDMRGEFYQKHYSTVLSRPLRDGIEKAMSGDRQVMLFLNRRGFSTFVYCKKCGNVEKCRRCDSTLVYHYSKKKLVCHHCGSSIDPPDICPKCKSTYVKYFGMGTEKVESELHRYFPERNISRMDTDTMRSRGSYDKVLGRFRRHRVNILVGTQMIAKGHDFPKVTLVGVVSADTTLNLPDFRASERTFNLLTQVAGRAGRSAEGGRVIIQTYTPDHYAIRAASEHDYEAFYNEEIISRKELGLPPFAHLVMLALSSKKEERLEKAAGKLAAAIKKRIKKAKVLGPMQAVIPKIRNRHRRNILIKTKDPENTAAVLKKVLASGKKPSGVSISVDVDPMSV